MKEIKGITIGALLVLSLLFTINYANAVDNNCATSIWTVLELTPILGCIEDRLDALENKPTGSDDTLCANVGSGSQIYKDGECNFRTVIGSSDISVTQQTDTITIDFNGTGGGETTECINVGSATLIIKNSTSGNCFVKSLVAGTGISITNGTDTITINSTVVDTDDQIQQIVAQVYQSVTKTNIGTSYIDVYATAFDEENMAERINFSNATYFQIWYLYDYVGVGTHQCRWVDSANNANVLYEDGTFTTDRDPDEGTLTVIPAWASTGIQRIEMQCKSTTGTDDPIVRGYKIATQ